jgi:hypothetical protein
MKYNIGNEIQHCRSLLITGSAYIMQAQIAEELCITRCTDIRCTIH